MAWNAVFPTGQTFISQSVTQIQANWAFINTFATTDHYFNSGTANEGHHKFAQMITQGGDVAPAGVGANLALYCKNNTAANPKLYDNTTRSGVRQINSFVSSQSGVVPANTATVGLLNFLTGPLENVTNGLFFVVSTTTITDVAVAYINFNGASLTTIPIKVNGNITNIFTSAPATLAISTNNVFVASTVYIQYMPMEI